MLDKNKITDIVEKLSKGTVLTDEDKKILISVLVERVTNTTSVSSKDFNIFDTKELKKYQTELDNIEKKIEDIKEKAGDKKLTKRQQDSLNNWIIKAENIRKRMKEIQTINDKVLELSIDINEEFEKQNRRLDKQLELRNLEIKSIREGLDLHEKIRKKLVEVGEQHNINTDKFKKGIDEVISGFGELKSGLGNIKSGVEKVNEAWGKVDQSAADFTKRIGGTAASMEKLRKTTIDFMETRAIGVKYNTSMEELIKLQGDYNASIGRSIDLTNDQKETFAAMKSVIGEQAAVDFSVKLENFGLNPDEVGSRVGEMFAKASKSGIAFEKYSKNFLDNIKLAQNYNFQNGLKGLEAMARKATAIKLDMQQVANFANKVSTLEGAVQAGSQLSVLGGSFARMGNPLSMLYEGLNDMEGLQDRMIKMFGNLGKWDYSKGQVDVSVFNKQRIKAAAEATGMDYSALMESINASARRNIVQGKLGSQYDNDQDFKELLLNKAQLDKEGNAFVTINGERKNVNKLTKSDQEYLKASNTSDSDNIAEIAVNTRGFRDVKEGFDKQRDVGAAQVNETLGIGQATKGILKAVGEKSWMMQIIGAFNPVLMMINGSVTSILGILAMSNGVGNMLGSFGKGGKMPGAVGSGNISGKAGWKNIGGKNYFMKKDGTLMTTAGKNGKVVTDPKVLEAAGSTGKVAGTAAKGMSATAKLGAGLGLGVAGMAVDSITDNTVGRDKGKNIGWYTAGKATSGALQGAALGAIFGPWGIAIGAGLGAAYGGVKGHIEAKKENLANQLRSTYNATINDPSIYDISELQTMQGGSSNLSVATKKKMSDHGDNLGGYDSGGIVSDGPSDKDSLMHGKAVRAGEYVVNADATKNNLPVLEAINNGNSLNIIQVSKNEQSSNNQNTNASSDLNVTFGGSITINIPNNTGIDSKVLEKALEQQFRDPKLITQLSNQLQRSDSRIPTNDRSKTRNKFALA